jgi:hypothetical protein
MIARLAGYAKTVALPYRAASEAVTGALPGSAKFLD